METQKQLFDRRVNVFLGDTASLSPAAFVTKPRSRPPRMVPLPRPPEIGADRLPLLWSSMTGLKPFADGIRNMSPFGLPIPEGQHQQTSRRGTGGVARSQVDPSQGGSGARAHRHRRWRDHSSLRLPECMEAPPPPVSVPPPAALREVRLNGFPGVLAGVLRHRVGGGGRRAPDPAPTGVFGAANAGEPAYPGYNPRAGEGRCPFDPRQTRAPVDGAGGGVAPHPPVAARPVG